MGAVELSIHDHTAIEVNDRAIFCALPPGGAFSGLFVIFANPPGADHIYIFGIHSNALLSLRCHESSDLLKPARIGTRNRSEDK